MKKFYSIFAIAAISLSANAHGIIEQPSPINHVKFTKVANQLQNVKFAEIVTPAITSVSSINEFEGSFDWEYYRPLGAGSDVEGTLTFKVVSGTEVAISGISSNLIITGTADLNANTLTFQPQDLEDVNISGLGMCQAKFETGEIIDNTLSFTNKPIVLTLTETGYEISSSVAFGISVYQNNARQGWLNLAAFNSITKPAADPDWEDAGEGTLTESFFSGTYTSAGSATSTVKIQVSTKDKNVIRICNYISSLKNYLEIDMTDPQNIVVPVQDTKYVDSTDGATYIGSVSAIYDEVEEGEYITLSGNTITFPSTSMLIRWPEAPADSQYGTDASLWYYGGNQDSTLTLPETVGIDNIITDSEDANNAPVEYFNLQGMKINNPTAGQIYIMRQGNDVKKVLVK